MLKHDVVIPQEIPTSKLNEEAADAPSLEVSTAWLAFGSLSYLLRDLWENFYSKVTPLSEQLSGLEVLPEGFAFSVLTYCTPAGSWFR